MFFAPTWVVGSTRYLFSVVLTARRAKLSPAFTRGLPWVIFPNRMGTEGAVTVTVVEQWLLVGPNKALWCAIFRIDKDDVLWMAAWRVD